jgi:hypothetical protein
MRRARLFGRSGTGVLKLSASTPCMSSCGAVLGDVQGNEELVQHSIAVDAANVYITDPSPRLP